MVEPVRKAIETDDSTTAIMDFCEWWTREGNGEFSVAVTTMDKQIVSIVMYTHVEKRPNITKIYRG